MRPLSPRRSAIVAALDIGTSKVTCLIGRLKPLAEDEAMRGRSHAVEVIGFGHTRARGVKAGVIADLAPAEEAIRTAVDVAEREAVWRSPRWRSLSAAAASAARVLRLPCGFM